MDEILKKYIEADVKCGDAFIAAQRKLQRDIVAQKSLEADIGAFLYDRRKKIDAEYAATVDAARKIHRETLTALGVELPPVPEEPVSKADPAEANDWVSHAIGGFTGVMGILSSIRGRKAAADPKAPAGQAEGVGE